MEQTIVRWQSLILQEHVVTKTEVTAAKNDPVVSTLELADAGTYYLGGLENNNYIFKVVVTDTVGGGNAPVVTRKNWSEVAAPVIGEVAQDGANVTSSIYNGSW